MHIYKCRCGNIEESCLNYSRIQLSCKKCGKQLKEQIDRTKYPRVPWKNVKPGREFDKWQT